MPSDGPNVVQGATLPDDVSANALTALFAPLEMYAAGWIAGLTWYVRVLVAEEGVVAASVTLTTTVAVPAAVGVPEIPPVVLSSVRPAGSVPDAMDHV